MSDLDQDWHVAKCFYPGGLPTDIKSISISSAIGFTIYNWTWILHVLWVSLTRLYFFQFWWR